MLHKALLKNLCSYSAIPFLNQLLKVELPLQREMVEKKIQIKYDTQFHLLCQQADNYIRLFFKSSLRCVTVLLKEESYF